MGIANYLNVKTETRHETAPNPWKRQEQALAKRVFEAINRAYFGHPWEVECDWHQGMVFIKIPALMGATNRYGIKINTLKGDPMCKIAVRFAGEILERYGLVRGIFRHDDFLVANNKIPVARRGFHGLVPD